MGAGRLGASGPAHPLDTLITAFYDAAVVTAKRSETMAHETVSEQPYILYGGPKTRAALVEQVMAEIGLRYELRSIDIDKQEHRSAAFLSVNPAGWAPALITPEGEALSETPAINLYLAERHGAAHLAPPPSDRARGAFLSGLFYVSGMLEPALKRFWYPHRYADGARGAAAVKERAFEEAATCFGVINDRLEAKGPFHLGARFSLVDLMIAFWSESFEPASLQRCEAIGRLHARVYDRPALRPYKGTLRSISAQMRSAPPR
ncbi:MAG: glutathione S-transferase family protein [Pseudomonadota bacterium]